MKPHRRDEGRLAGKPRCPTCGKTLDGFTGIGNDSHPSDGDISICGYCATPLVAAGEEWVKMGEALLAEAMREPEFMLAMAVVRSSKKEFEH